MRQILLLLLAALIIATKPASAQQPTIDLVQGPGTTRDHSVTIGVGSLATEIRLRNTGKEAVTLRVEPGANLRRRDDGLSVPAEWRQVLPGPSKLLSRSETVPLGSQSDLLLSLTATLLQPGVYETAVDVFPTSGAALPDQTVERRIRVIVTREAAELPSGLITAPKPLALSWPLGVWGKLDTVIEVRNSTPRTLELYGPLVVSFSEGEAASQTGVAGVPPSLVPPEGCGPTKAATAWTLAPHQPCAMNLEIDNFLSPGLYQADFVATGVGGQSSEASQIIRVRASGVIAFLVFLLGSLAGFFVHRWRTVGRGAVDQLLALARYRESLAAAEQRLSAAGLGAGVTALRTMLASVDAKVRSGAATAAEQVAIGQRLKLLSDAARLAGARAQFQPPELALVDPRWQYLLVKLEDPDVPTDEISKIVVSLGEEFKVVGDYVQRIAEVSRLADTLKRAAGSQLEPEALGALADKLQESLAVAERPLKEFDLADTLATKRTVLETVVTEVEKDAAQKAGTIATSLKADIEARISAKDPKSKAYEAVKGEISGLAGGKLIDRLEGLIAAHAKLNALASNAGPEAEVMAEAADVKGPPSLGLAVDFPADFGLPPIGATSQEIEKRRKWLEWTTNAIVMGAISLAGVLTFWPGNPTWGSFADIATAFLTAAAARFMIGDAGLPEAPKPQNH